MKKLEGVDANVGKIGKIKKRLFVRVIVDVLKISGLVLLLVVVHIIAKIG